MIGVLHHVLSLVIADLIDVFQSCSTKIFEKATKSLLTVIFKTGILPKLYFWDVIFHKLF